MDVAPIRSVLNQPSQQPLMMATQKTQTACLVILTLIAGGFALAYLQSVILPFIIALFMVIGCQPVLEFLEVRLKLPWFLSFLVTFALGFVLLTLFAVVTWISIHDLAQNASAYQQRIDAVLSWAAVFVSEPDESDDEESDEEKTENENTIDDGESDASKSGSVEENNETESEASPNSSIDEEPNDTVQTIGSGIESGQGSDSSSDQSDGQNDEQSGDSDTLDAESLEIDGLGPIAGLDRNRRPQLSSISQPSRDEKTTAALEEMLSLSNAFAQRVVLALASSLTFLMSYGILVLIFVFFLLLGRASTEIESPPILTAIEEQVRKYIVLKTVISFFTGLATTIVLWLFGVPLAVVFGLLAFLLNFIPNIGPLICCALPVPFLVLNSEMSPWVAAIAFVLVCTIQFLSGNYFEPRIMGKSFDISPIVLLLALMFFGLVWGIVGMFIATPLVSIIKIILQQNEASRPFANLLAGRWDKSFDKLGSGEVHS